MIYFDNAATGFPKPKDVINAVQSALITCGNPGRGIYKYSLKGSDIIYSLREKLASSFKTTPEKVILCPGATYALNFSIKGLKKTGTKVLISDLEHNAVVRPSYAETPAVIFEADLSDDNVTVNNVKNALHKNDISVVAITHASNVCGRILPIKEIASVCKKYSIPIILDASQTAGYMPLDFIDYPVDVICIPGHKGFCGPMGTGALIVNPSSNLYFSTLIEGGTGIRSLETAMPEELPERLEGGTMAIQDFAGLSAAITICKYNVEEIKEMFKYVLSPLSALPYLKIYGEPISNAEKYMPIISFNGINISPSEFAERLSHAGFCVRSGFHCSPLAHKKLKTGDNGAVRVSIGKNNTIDDCYKLLKAINKICMNL